MRPRPPDRSPDRPAVAGVTAHGAVVQPMGTMADFAPMVMTKASAPNLESSHGDDELMQAYANGDAAAFDRLYERHRAALYRFVRRLVGTTHQGLIDEVYQDTWLRVVQSRDRWAPQGASFKTWLFTLAHHRAIDVLRRSGRELSMDASDEGPTFEPDGLPWQRWPEPSSHAPTAEDQLFWRRAGERMLDCLAQLPVGQRAAFLMHHEDGTALDAIAAALGEGFETIKSRLRYARAKLRLCMGAYLAPIVTDAAEEP